MRSLLVSSAAGLSRWMASATTASAVGASRHCTAFITTESGSASSSGQTCQQQPSIVSPAAWGAQSGANFGLDLLPQICATPKKKLSVHRRGNRRVWYWLKRKPEYAKCSFCGALAGRNHMFSGAAGNSLCTGQCVEQPNEKVAYPAEYQPPC